MILTIQAELLRLLTATAIFAAVAGLALVHRTILARVLAIWLVRCKRDRAHCCNQNREEDFRVVFHRLSFVCDGY
jgi:hypothetical protein